MRKQLLPALRFALIMKHLFPVLVFFSSAATATVLAQTPAETLEKSVTDYNALKTYVAGLNPKTITDANVADCKTRMDKGVAMLDQVIREGNSDEIKTARYFRVNFQYQYSFVLGMKGENRQSLDVMRAIEREFTALKSSDFPLRYVFTGKNYIINWDNFAPTQAEYYTGFGEVLYNLGHYEDAVRVSKIALAHPNSSDWLRYIAANKLLDANAKNNLLIPASEVEELALRSILLYDALPEESKKTVSEYNYPRVLRGTNILLANVQQNANPTTVNRCAEAAQVAGKYEAKSAKVLQLYEAAYRNNYAGTDKSRHQAAAAYAQTTLVIDRQRSEFVGQSAADRMAQLTGLSDCEGLRAVAEMYRVWLKPNLQAEYLKKAGQCEAERARSAKKAEQAQRRGGSGGFNLFVGANVFPLINTNPKRDYGAVVNFAFPKTALEFSYMIVNQNKENIFDLWIREVDDADQDNISRWDGFKAHFMPKFMMDNGVYTGVMLGYAEKNFESMIVPVTNDLTGVVRNEAFQPGVKQYSLLVQFGAMPLAKGFGADLYMGFGANYNIFDDGSDIDREAFTIANPLLEHRRDKFFGATIRMGMTLGLNFGKGN